MRAADIAEHARAIKRLAPSVCAALQVRLAVAVPPADQQTEFSAAYFVLSLMIGFIAGVLAGLAIGIQNVLNIDPGDIKVLLGIAASGYAGADFIENSLSQVAALAAANYRAVAPSQRGYLPDARPDTGDSANYHIDRLMDDAMAMVGASQQPLLITPVGPPPPHSDLSIFQKIGVAGPSSTPVSDFRHALGMRYCPSGM